METTVAFSPALAHSKTLRSLLEEDLSLLEVVFPTPDPQPFVSVFPPVVKRRRPSEAGSGWERLQDWEWQSDVEWLSSWEWQELWEHLLLLRGLN